MASRIISYWAPGGRDTSDQDWQQCQDNLHHYAIEKGGIDESDPWNLDRLCHSPIYHEHQEIFNQPRGAGYWLWKPYIILESLKSMSPGDFVIYHDVGKPDQDKAKPNRFFRDVTPVFEFVRNNSGIFPGPYIPSVGPNKAWVKRDCFILMDCEGIEYRQHCQIQASYNIWQVRPESINFVERWLDYCTDPRILTDQPNEMGVDNWPAFIGHRHDQAVLTLLCIKHGIRSFGSPKATIYRHRNINFFVQAYLDSIA